MTLVTTGQIMGLKGLKILLLLLLLFFLFCHTQTTLQS